MEINQSAIVVGIILICICVIPFAIIAAHKAKRKKRMLQLLNEAAAQFQSRVTHYEFCRDFIIATDQKTSVFFCSEDKKNKTVQTIDLSTIRSCEIEKKTSSMNSGNITYVIVEKLDLLFLPAEKTKQTLRIELYDREIQVMLSGELQLADRWLKQINKLLNEKKQT